MYDELVGFFVLTGFVDAAVMPFVILRWSRVRTRRLLDSVGKEEEPASRRTLVLKSPWPFEISSLGIAPFLVIIGLGLMGEPISWLQSELNLMVYALLVFSLPWVLPLFVFGSNTIVTSQGISSFRILRQPVHVRWDHIKLVNFDFRGAATTCRVVGNDEAVLLHRLSNGFMSFEDMVLDRLPENKIWRDTRIRRGRF